MASITIKVNTSVMVNKAGELKSQIKKIKGSWETLKKAVNNSKTYWEGEASNRHIEMLNKEQENVENVIKRLEEHPDDLLKMADLYVKSEEKNENLANELPTDIIS